MIKRKRALRTEQNKDDGWEDSQLFESFLQHDKIRQYSTILEKDRVDKLKEEELQENQNKYDDEDDGNVEVESISLNDSKLNEIRA